MKRIAGKLLERVGLAITQANVAHFHADSYLRHNARRLEHLASLGLEIRGKSVLEVGAGIGDHSHFFLDRDCQLTITDVRKENLEYLRDRYPDVRIERLDMEAPRDLDGAPFQVVYCYGLLYHVSRPDAALAYLSGSCSEMLLLETQVSTQANKEFEVVPELKGIPTQSASGLGSRPSREWIWQELKRHFAHVYMPRTQPNHYEFPVDWASGNTGKGPVRAIFVASRQPVPGERLCSELLSVQERQG